MHDDLPPACPHHERLERKVDMILIAIGGDVAMGHRGISKRLEDVEMFKAEVEKEKWKRHGAAAAVGGIVIAAWEVIKIKLTGSL